ncbi:MAG: O-antigen ligase family protein, partial [Gaiellaceae bacterium]
MRTWAVALGVAALGVAAAGSEGAYFSQSWGWVALAFVCPVALVLILGWARAPGRLRVAFALLVTGLGVWIALSATWSLSPAASIREVERMLAYVGLALAVAFVLRRGDEAALAAGIFAGVAVIASYALATRLFQDRFETFDYRGLPYRLAEPIGYWNSLGLLTAIGILVGLGFLAHAKRVVHAAVAGVSLPVLATTLYFTFSRGAWAALGVGLVATVALDPRRFRLVWSTLSVLPASVACVAIASQQEALTTEEAPQADAVAQGHRLAAVIVAFALLSGVLAVGAALVARRVDVPRWALRSVDAGLAALAVAGLLIAVVLAGGPRDALAGLKDRFDTPTVPGGQNLNERLFSVSGNGRQESFGVAWDAARDRPVLGHGAGSYEYLWYQQRPSLQVIRDAHSLYVEMLAEVGVVGLALLCLGLVVPMVAAVRARRTRLVPAAAGAYLAWVAHSAVDWNWELVAV